jgi:peptidyl-prolyl cis-trans isomerase C
MVTMKLTRRLLLIAALLPLPVLAANPAPAEAPIAQVNGVDIPKSRFDMILQSQTAQGQPDTPEFREDLREVLITREVLAQEALRQNMDKNPAYVAQMDAMRQQILLGILFEDFLKKNNPSEQQMRAEYDRAKAEAETSGEREYLVRHILVKEQEDAKGIIAQVKGGADFAAIAREKSLDPGSKDSGGELNWSTPERYVGPFAEAIRTLKKGELSAEPVQTSYGWHVIHVVDERTPPFPPFEQVSEQIKESLIGQARDALIDELRAKAKIDKTGSISAGK